MITLTTARITRQDVIVSFPPGTASRQILCSDGSWTGGEVEPAWEKDYTSQGYKLTATVRKVDSRSCAF